MEMLLALLTQVRIKMLAFAMTEVGTTALITVALGLVGLMATRQFGR